MTIYLKTFLTLSLLTLFILFIGTDLIAQPSLPTDPIQAPINGGLIFLATGGMAYALKKLKDRKTE